jgi:hypothetical protein
MTLIDVRAHNKYTLTPHKIMKTLLSALAILILPVPVSADGLAIAVTGGKIDQTNIVCTVALPETESSKVEALKLPDGKYIWAQSIGPGVLVGPAELEKQGKTRHVVFVLPALKAGETVTLIPISPPDESKSAKRFSFAEEKGKHTDLLYGTRTVLRYINSPHDPANHFLMFKPFHQVFDPVEGKTLLTSGAHAKPTEGLYPHHRGLFFGFNEISYGAKQKADIWHGKDNVFSQHEKVLGKDTGRVLGRERAEISWHGKDAATFASENREVTVYAVPGGTMIDWSTVLSTTGGDVKLDGDPQHAGFHFRAAQEVAEKIKIETELAKKEDRKPKPADTYYLRPDGKGGLGETRNWEPKGADPKTVNLPWDAMSFVVGGKRYTVLRINHPDNPKETRGSERDYGRFGDYFEYTLTADKPLRLRYRVWVQEGEMTVDQCKAMAADFLNPPVTKIVALK